MQISPRYLKGSDYQRACVLFEKGKLAEARAKAQAVDEGSPDYKRARRLLRQINAVSIQLAGTHMELGDEYEQAGIYDKALEEYRTSFLLNPSPLVNLKIEEVLGKMPGNEKQAKNEQSPEYYANRHYVKGKFYLESKAYGKAISEFNLTLKYVPSYMNTRELLARARSEMEKDIDRRLKSGIGYFQAEEMEKAIMQWDIVLGLDPGNRAAADYKHRAEVIMERLKHIRQKEEQNL